MTVLDFIRAHFSLDSQVDNLLVRRNTDGFCETLYNGAIDDERYMKPEVKCATIRKWCLPRRGVPLSLLSSKGSGLMRVCWNRQTGKLEVLVSVLACGFKSHFPHQCKGHSIFECPLFLFIEDSKINSIKDSDNRIRVFR